MRLAASPDDVQGMLEYVHVYFDGRERETRFAIIREAKEPAHEEMRLRLATDILPLETHAKMIVTLLATKEKEKYLPGLF